MKIVWHGHSCFWIESRGVKLLIDPYPDVDDDKIGDVDYILITHEHSDHYGKVELLSRLRDAEVIGPRPVCTMAEEEGVKRIREVRAGETLDLDGVTVRTLLVEHPSSQYPMAYLIKGDRNLLHTGDTYPTPLLRNLGERIDILLVPISGRSTANEMEAAQIIEDLRPRITIPMHYGTYSEGDPEKLRKILMENRIFTLLKVLRPLEEFEV
ncbi:MAG: MBL fold metallo-hydrolase [Thermococci archaeon]|nr:MBL fold metallo-hydrolase [Thermococci archaeon]